MKVSAFSICRNALKFDFPVVEAIKSALPLVDEFVVNVGRSDDDTLELIRSIASDKIRIVESVWDESQTSGGLVLSQQTNIALSHCTGDWALYLQADEVLHEGEHEVIQRTLRGELSNQEVLAFTLRYHHFYGDYWSVNPWAYHRAVRVIRNNGTVISCGDAVGFCLKQDGGYMQSRHRVRVRACSAFVYHYGWVKPPKTLSQKLEFQVRLYHGDDAPSDHVIGLGRDGFEFPDYAIMKNFRGSHPAVMKERLAQSAKLRGTRNRWLNPLFYRAVVKRGFRG